MAKKLTDPCTRLLAFDPHNQLTTGIIYEDDLEAVMDHMDGPRWRVIYRFTHSIDETRWLFYYALAKENCVVLLDEISYFARPNYMVPGLEQMVRYAGARNIRIVGCTHRPQDCHPLIFGESELYCFRLREPRALKKMAEVWDGSRDELPRLADYAFLRYDARAPLV